jgi:hypothetical protein
MGPPSNCPDLLFGGPAEKLEISHGLTNREELHAELVSRGYIPASPDLEPIAFSVEGLRLYMEDLMQGQTSREGWTAALCSSLQASASRHLNRFIDMQMRSWLTLPI